MSSHTIDVNPRESSGIGYIEVMMGTVSYTMAAHRKSLDQRRWSATRTLVHGLAPPP